MTPWVPETAPGRRPVRRVMLHLVNPSGWFAHGDRIIARFRLVAAGPTGYDGGSSGGVTNARVIARVAFGGQTCTISC